MMFIIVLLICLCLSSSAGAGGYFYTTGKKDEEIIDATGENFELKYQEAVRALEAEKQAKLQVDVAKTDLEKAQERLAIAKLEFEGFEFEDDESRQRARTKVFEAEKAAEEAISRLDEAETYAEKAAIERDVAEKNADSALEVAITNATAAVTKAEGEASARLIAANARLDEAKLDAAAVIEAAEAYAADVLARGEADRKKIIDDANARLAAATSDAETAEIQREIDKADRDWAKEKEGILADLDSKIETANEDLAEAQEAVSTANEDLTEAQAARDEAVAATEAALLATADARDEADAIRAGAESDADAIRAGAESDAAGILAGAEADAAKSIGYEHNWSGAEISMDANNPNVGGAFNDRLTSMKIGTNRWVRIFKNDQYRGTNRTFFTGLTGVDPMNDEMTSFTTGEGSHPADTLVNGNAVRCIANDVGKGLNGAVYRADGQTRVLRHYPNAGIADSWDPTWRDKNIQIDCAGFTLGADMPRKPSTSSGGYSSGNCVSKVKGRQADDSCRFRSASGCENKGTCELV